MRPMAFVCDLAAIQAADRPRYHALVGRLRASVREVEELEDGYAFRLDMPASDVEEWARMERLCCPFFAIELRADGWMSLRGAPGAKAIVEAEWLPSRRSEA